MAGHQIKCEECRKDANSKKILKITWHGNSFPLVGDGPGVQAYGRLERGQIGDTVIWMNIWSASPMFICWMFKPCFDIIWATTTDLDVIASWQGQSVRGRCIQVVSWNNRWKVEKKKKNNYSGLYLQFVYHSTLKYAWPSQQYIFLLKNKLVNGKTCSLIYYN